MSGLQFSPRLSHPASPYRASNHFTSSYRAHSLNKNPIVVRGAGMNLIRLCRHRAERIHFYEHHWRGVRVEMSR